MDGLLESIPARLFDEWQSWYAVEHLGPHPNFRADLRQAKAALLAIEIAAAGKGTALTVQDLMIAFEGDETPTRDWRRDLATFQQVAVKPTE